MRLPDPAALLALPVHVLVRDYPESLAVLRRLGVDVAARGGEAVAAAVGADAAALFAGLQKVAGWREHAAPTACDREAERMTSLREGARAAAAARGAGAPPERPAAEPATPPAPPQAQLPDPPPPPAAQPPAS